MPALSWGGGSHADGPARGGPCRRRCSEREERPAAKFSALPTRLLRPPSHGTTYTPCWRMAVPCLTDLSSSPQMACFRPCTERWAPGFPCPRFPLPESVQALVPGSQGQQRDCSMGVAMIVGPRCSLPQVILRRPHEFKIRCLEDIRSLFPPDWNPFYAGFGNRETDEISYLAVGVPPSRIFTINPKGARAGPAAPRLARAKGGGGGALARARPARCVCSGGNRDGAGAGPLRTRAAFRVCQAGHSPPVPAAGPWECCRRASQRLFHRADVHAVHAELPEPACGRHVPHPQGSDGRQSQRRSRGGCGPGLRRRGHALPLGFLLCK